MKRRLIWFALFCVVICGCDPERTRTKREFSRLNHSLQKLQRANNEHKAPFLQALSREPCQRLCEFRDACLHAYETHQRALSLLAELKSQLVVPEGGFEEVPPDGAPGVVLSDDVQAVRDLARAQSLLLLARPLTRECAARQGELSRKWAR